MEPGQIEGDDNVETTMGTFVAPALATQVEHFDCPKIDPFLAKRKIMTYNQDSQPQMKDTTPSVSKCYVFKSRLQEYCQKAGVTSPVYETIKEGPSHEPYFRSTVILNDVRYDSLPGFFNRKAAEQSAAEVALVELAKSSNIDSGITQPVHETGLCKNLLQEYAQKMNYAIPFYETRMDERDTGSAMYSCTVDIGGIKYVGASANTKKEAEKKAARIALLAIQTAVPVSQDQTGDSVYTVIPQKKKVPEPIITTQETHKPKKGRPRKQFPNKKRAKRVESYSGGRLVVMDDSVMSEVYMNGQSRVDPQDKTNGGTDMCVEARNSESNAIRPCL